MFGKPKVRRWTNLSTVRERRMTHATRTTAPAWVIRRFLLRYGSSSVALKSVLWSASFWVHAPRYTRFVIYESGNNS